MRTIVKLDAELAKELAEIAPQGEKPLGDVISETVSNGLQARESSKPYQLATVSLGGVCADVNLDKALSLADAIDDEEFVRKAMSGR
jgi:hypothetical protein